MSAGKTAFDVKLNDGATISAPGDIGLAATTSPTTNCMFGAGSDNIVCKIQGGPSTVKDQKIKLTRNSDGAWACSTSVTADDAAKVVPTGACPTSAATIADPS
ncbi:MAG: hypothetical protein ACJ8HJ_19235 [Massilia sp.]